jgi:hypothetical protein
MKKKKEKSIFQQEMERDFNTFKRLPPKKKVQFVFDYYKWYILAGITIIFIIVNFAHMLWEGQKPYRLRTCVVLNTNKDCSVWFRDFEKELKSDGKPYDFGLNLDQPFNSDNMYHYVEEIKVQSTVSAGRMDVAVCGPDMYEYLLKMNTCTPIDQVFSDEEITSFKNLNMLVKSTAGLIEDDDGNVDDSKAVDGYFALDISNTKFGETYNNKKDTDDPLYAIIILNTEHLEDSLTQVRALVSE